MDKKDGGPIDLESLRGFTPGPWAVESIRNEGNYGDGGSDCRSGFDSYCVQDAEGRALFDTLNSDYRVAIVHEDVHDEGVTAWDEQGLRNITLAASAPALLNECQRLQAELTTRRARDAEVAELIAAASELVEVSRFAAMLDVMPANPDANGPLPRTMAALVNLTGGQSMTTQGK